MIIRILFFLGSMAVGFGLLVYTLKWVGWVGKSGWAEDKLGSGGTYTMWKLIGILIMIFGFLVLFGTVKLSPGVPVVDQEQTSIQE
jgi:hypothetical protein